MSLFSYRVFAKGANASNFDIAKAVDRARLDRCDIINLSLGRPVNAGEGPDEPLVRFALEDAREAGIPPIAAAGNDGRSGVSFPASDDLCIAVSALGNRKASPQSSVLAAAFMLPTGGEHGRLRRRLLERRPGDRSVRPRRRDHLDGPKRLCRYGRHIHGVSAVTGIVARLLAGRSDIVSMTGEARSAALAQLAVQAARTRGFTRDLEGHGLPT